MQLRRAVLHRLLHIEHERQGFVFDLQRAHALHGGNLVLGDHDRHVVAIIAHMRVQKPAVRNVLMLRIHRPRMPRGREIDLRRVKAGQDLNNARDIFGFRCVDRFHEPVRDLAVLDAHIQRARGHAVLVVFRPSGRLVEGVHADLAFADDAHIDSFLNVYLYLYQV